MKRENRSLLCASHAAKGDICELCGATPVQTNMRVTKPLCGTLHGGDESLFLLFSVFALHACPENA